MKEREGYALGMDMATTDETVNSNSYTTWEAPQQPRMNQAARGQVAYAPDDSTVDVRGNAPWDNEPTVAKPYSPAGQAQYGQAVMEAAAYAPDDSTVDVRSNSLWENEPTEAQPNRSAGQRQAYGQTGGQQYQQQPWQYAQPDEYEQTQQFRTPPMQPQQTRQAAPSYEQTQTYRPAQQQRNQGGQNAGNAQNQDYLVLPQDPSAPWDREATIPDPSYNSTAPANQGQQYAAAPWDREATIPDPSYHPTAPANQGQQYAAAPWDREATIPDPSYNPAKSANQGQPSGAAPWDREATIPDPSYNPAYQRQQAPSRNMGNQDGWQNGGNGYTQQGEAPFQSMGDSWGTQSQGGWGQQGPSQDEWPQQEQSWQEQSWQEPSQNSGGRTGRRSTQNPEPPQREPEPNRNAPSRDDYSDQGKKNAPRKDHRSLTLKEAEEAENRRFENENQRYAREMQKWKSRIWIAVLMPIAAAGLILLAGAFGGTVGIVAAAIALLATVSILGVTGKMRWMLKPKKPKKTVPQMESPEISSVYSVRLRLQSVNLAKPVEVTIRQEEQILGCDPVVCPHPLDFRGISHRHCSIISKQQHGHTAYYIRDEHSKNGTKLNDSRLESGVMYPLQIGDTITLAGRYSFRVMSDAL